MFSSIRNLRILGNIEGVSYLILLGIAMPLKYFGDNEILVKLIGPIHGFLWLLYIGLLTLGWIQKKWNMRRQYSSKIDTADFYCLPTIRA